MAGHELKTKAKADPLAPTYELILALNNVLKIVFNLGLLKFLPRVRCHRIRSGRFVTRNGDWGFGPI